MQISTIGIDLAKNIFQVHAVDAAEKLVLKKQFRRSQVLEFFSKLSPCLVGMEACATSHRHDVRLMPANYVKAPNRKLKAKKSLTRGRRPHTICDISAQFLL
jgi:transposase